MTNCQLEHSTVDCPVSALNAISDRSLRSASGRYDSRYAVGWREDTGPPSPRAGPPRGNARRTRPACGTIVWMLYMPVADKADKSRPWPFPHTA